MGGAVGLAHLVDNLRDYVGIRRFDEFEKRFYTNVIRGIERELVEEKSKRALTSLRGPVLDNLREDSANARYNIEETAYCAE